MRNAVFAALGSAVLLGGCAGYDVAWFGSPTDKVQIDDSPIDIRTCRKLGIVSDTVPTTPNLNPRLEVMIAATRALGGTDLYLRKMSRDWSYIRGEAYRCRDSRFLRRGETTVIRVRY